RLPAPQPHLYPRVRLARLGRLPARARQHDRPHDQPRPHAEAPRPGPRVRAAPRHGPPAQQQGGAPAPHVPPSVVRGMKPLRILALGHPDLVPPDNMEELSEKEAYVWKTEYDVMKTLRTSGHEVRMLGVQTELTPIRDAVENWKTDIVFNLLEEFHGES